MKKLDSMDPSEAEEETEHDGIEVTDNIREVNEDGNELTAAQ